MLNENLKEIRSKLALSQSDIARSLGMHAVQYGSYERGDRKPSADVLEKLVTKFNVNINYLLTGKGSMFITDNEKPLLTFKVPKNSNVFLEIE